MRRAATFDYESEISCCALINELCEAGIEGHDYRLAAISVVFELRDIIVLVDNGCAPRRAEGCVISSCTQIRIVVSKDCCPLVKFSIVAFPRRWPHRPVEQRRRTSSPRHCAGPEVVAVLWLRPRGRRCRDDVQPDRHGQMKIGSTSLV